MAIIISTNRVGLEPAFAVRNSSNWTTHPVPNCFDFFYVYFAMYLDIIHSKIDAKKVKYNLEPRK
jgi:hypothetical protein